mmetsp:Transcript_19320/g.58566  ORF Transcript_19320/g.58566 Transcript_19320/m.58566 type:complete len:92 (+) Transcript_19320:397-672(+)
MMLSFVIDATVGEYRASLYLPVWDRQPPRRGGGQEQSEDHEHRGAVTAACERGRRGSSRAGACLDSTTPFFVIRTRRAFLRRSNASAARGA